MQVSLLSVITAILVDKLFRWKKIKRRGRKHTCKIRHLQKGYMQIPFLSKGETSRRYKLQLFPAEIYKEQSSCLPQNVKTPGNPASKVLSVFSYPLLDVHSAAEFTEKDCSSQKKTFEILHSENGLTSFFFIRKDSWFSLLSVWVYFISLRICKVLSASAVRNQ